ADLWFVGGGTAQRIASISGDSITRLRIDDVGPSGRNVALRIGYGDDTGGGCDDLYVIRSDRESMTRGTRMGPGRHAVGGLISSDDRYIAWTDIETGANGSAYGVADLAGDLTPRIALCSETPSALHPAWAPNDDRLAVVCGTRMVMDFVGPQRHAGQ